MSHFTVLVIGNDPEEQLKDFDENIEVPEYITGTVSKKDMDNFVNCYTTYDPKKSYIKITRIEADENKELSFYDLYKKYGDDWNSCAWGYDKEKKIWVEYSTYNPKSKWDWYMLGGRWRGFFKLKDKFMDDVDVLGEPGTGGNEPIYDADQTIKCRIDFEFMKKDKLKETEKTYSEFEKEFMKDSERKNFDPYFDYGVENIGDRDNFVPETKDMYMDRNQLSTFAVVKDGKWYERGEMGWFACVSNEKKPETWNKIFWKLVNESGDNDLFSVYDCHI